MDEDVKEIAPAEGETDLLAADRFSPDWQPKPGRFGDYEFLEQIAHGGMGVVYRARQISLDRVVAVKLLLLGPLASRETIERFHREAQAAASLRHPNIVAIYEVGEVEGQPFFSMDYVEGRSLAQVIAERGVRSAEFGEAADWVRVIAEAVHYAHQHCILHRDLKPANVLIDAQNQVRINDFGLAKRLDLDSSLTMSGQTIGSPSYLPPEQAAGQNQRVGPASDVYSIGAILYELLAGRPPFLGQSVQDTLIQIRDKEPLRPRLLNPGIPRDLETICLKCLNKEPHRRYTSAQALAEDLERWLAAKPIQARPVGVIERGRLWCRRKPALAAAYALVGLLLLLLSIGSPIAAYRINKARQQALANAGAEKQERQRAERSFYAANMNLAQQAWEQDSIFRLRQLLEETQASQERGFEWYYWQRQTHLELNTLRGHDAGISSVAFSPDGQRIVAGSGMEAKVWETASGRRLFTLKGMDSSGVLAVAFSPEGQRILTGSASRTVKVWEAASGRELRNLTRPGNNVRCLAFSPDGQRVVTGSEMEAKVWEADSGRELRTLKGHSNQVSCVAFSPDGQRIVTGSDDQTAKVWEADSGRELRTLKGHSNQVSCVAFSPDGQRIVTGSYDQGKVWEAASGRELFTFKSPSFGCTCVAFSPDGQRIVTGSYNAKAKVWEAVYGKELFTLKGHTHGIRAVAFSPDGQRIVTGSEDRTAKVWEAAGGRELLTFKLPSFGGVCVAFSPDGQRVVADSGDQMAKVWETASGRELCTLKGHSNHVSSVAFSRDGQRIVTGSQGEAKVWEAASGRELRTLNGPGGYVRCLAFSPDGQRVIAGSEHSELKVWEVASGRELFTLDAHCGMAGGDVLCVAFSPEGRRLVAGTYGGAKVWEAASGRELLTLAEADSPLSNPTVTAVAFSPGGKLIVTAIEDRGAQIKGRDEQMAKVWEAASGKELFTLRGHTQGIQSVAFSADGHRIVTGSWDRTVRLWEAASGRELCKLERDSIAIKRAAFSADGQWVVAGGYPEVMVWQAAGAEQVAAWQAEERASRLGRSAEETIDGIALSPDGRRVATTSLAQTSKIRDTTPKAASVVRGALSEVRLESAYIPLAIHLKGDPSDREIRSVRFAGKVPSEGDGAGEIWLDTRHADLNLFGDVFRRVGKKPGPIHVKLRYVATGAGQTTNLTFPPRDSRASQGFRLYDLVFSDGLLDGALQLVLGTKTMGPHRLLSCGPAPPNKVGSKETPGHLVLLYGDPPITSAFADAPLGREIDLDGYYTGVDGRIHRLGVHGTPGGIGTLDLDPNFITFDSFGEPVLFTLMGYQHHEVTLKLADAADPLGQGRRLYWAVLKDARNMNRVAVVLGRTEIGPHRVLLYRGDQVEFIVPAHLADRRRQEIEALEIATLSTGEQQAIADLRRTIGYGFQCQIENGQAVALRFFGWNTGHIPPEGVLARLPHLHSVDFSDGTFSAAGLADLGRLPHLKFLMFSRAELQVDGLVILKDLDQLEALTFYDCRGITDEGVRHLGGLIGLKRLSFYSNEILRRPPDAQRCITDGGVVHLKRLVRLESLDLFGHDLSDASVPILTGMTELQELALSGHGLTDAALDGLAGLAKLRKLRLFETTVTTNGVAALKRRLPGLQVEAWGRDAKE